MRIGAFFLGEKTGQAEVIENVACLIATTYQLNLLIFLILLLIKMSLNCTTEIQTEITAGPTPSGVGFGDMSNCG